MATQYLHPDVYDDGLKTITLPTFDITLTTQQPV